MRLLIVLIALLIAAPAAADIAPIPDKGPVSLTVAGLHFAIQPVVVKYPPGYSKTFQVAVLTGCVPRHANCKLAQAKNLIGMEVASVDGASLRPEPGRLAMIADAFKHARGEVSLELYRRIGSDQATVSFARK